MVASLKMELRLATTRECKQSSLNKRLLSFSAYFYFDLSFDFISYGNLAAVAAAITLDPEALNVVIDDDPINGNVREPLLKVIQTLRSLSFTRRSEMKLA